MQRNDGLHPSHAPNVCLGMTTSSATGRSPLDELIGTVDPFTDDPRGAGAAIQLDQLSKTYADGTEAVRGITLTVASGEAYGMLGPNGAGKSTTIGMLGGLVRPTAGRAQVAGFDVATTPREVRRRVGFAMQQAGVDEFATAQEMLVLQARLHGLDRPEAGRRASLLLAVMDLEDVAQRRLGTLSGGMARRVDLAAALMHLPRILFLDEPTEGLDPRSRVAVWDALDELRRRAGITLVLTTHYMDEADRLCDRIGIVDRGQLVTEGDSRELKSRVGNEALVVEFPGEADAAQIARAERALAAVEDARRVQLAGRAVSVFVDDAAGIAPRALRALQLAGLTPRSIAITQPTLEDVYLRYTGRAFATDGQDDKTERMAA